MLACWVALLALPVAESLLLAFLVACVSSLTLRALLVASVFVWTLLAFSVASVSALTVLALRLSTPLCSRCAIAAGVLGPLFFFAVNLAKVRGYPRPLPRLRCGATRVLYHA